MSLTSKKDWATYGKARDERAIQRAQQDAEDAALQAARNAEAAAYKKQYLDNLDAQREAKRREDEAEIDRILEPTKARLRGQWLADHPDKTAQNFESKAWPQLRPGLVEDLRIAAAAEQKQSLLGSGRYTGI